MPLASEYRAEGIAQIMRDDGEHVVACPCRLLGRLKKARIVDRLRGANGEVFGERKIVDAIHSRGRRQIERQRAEDVARREERHRNHGVRSNLAQQPPVELVGAGLIEHGARDRGHEHRAAAAEHTENRVGPPGGPQFVRRHGTE